MVAFDMRVGRKKRMLNDVNMNKHCEVYMK